MLLTAIPEKCQSQCRSRSDMLAQAAQELTAVTATITETAKLILAPVGLYTAHYAIDVKDIDIFLGDAANEVSSFKMEGLSIGIIPTCGKKVATALSSVFSYQALRTRKPNGVVA